MLAAPREGEVGSGLRGVDTERAGGMDRRCREMDVRSAEVLGERDDPPSRGVGGR